MTETATQKLKYIIAISAAVATLLLYLPSLRNDFVGVWDDNAYVVENPHIRSLDAAFFRWAFLDFHVSNWHPLTWISHALDYALWGLNPLGHHLTNIVLHAVNTALVVLLALKLLEIARERSAQNGPASFLNDRTVLIAAGVTGLLFGIHPVHVESVAWVAERKDLLCALFFLLSIMAYVKALTRLGHDAESERLTLGAMLSALCFFILALLSKPMAVSLPTVLLILDWYPLDRIRSWKTLWSASVEKLPFLALSLASSLLTILAQSSGKSIGSLEVIPLSARLLVAFRSLIAYIGKMMLPLNLIPFYPYPKDVSALSLEYASAIILVLGITTACVLLVKKQKLWISVWGYYAVTLVPVLGIVQVGNQAMADRYIYLPSIGPFLVAGLCIAVIVQKASFFSKNPALGMIAPLAVAIVMFFPLAASAVQQIGVWKSGFVLWDHVITKGFESATAYNNRGLSLDDMERPDQAAADFERAIRLDPRSYFAYNNMGVIYGKDGKFQRSIEYFLKAVAINPNYADSYCNLGLSYFNINQYDNALDNYNKAILLNQDFDMAYLNRGNLYLISGNKELASKDYRKACGLGNGKACEILNLVSRE